MDLILFKNPKLSQPDIPNEYYYQLNSQGCFEDLFKYRYRFHVSRFMLPDLTFYDFVVN